MADTHCGKDVSKRVTVVRMYLRGSRSMADTHCGKDVSKRV